MGWEPPTHEPVFFLGEPEALKAEQAKDQARLAAEASRLALERFARAKVEEIRAQIIATDGARILTTVNLVGNPPCVCHILLHADGTWDLEP